MKQAFRLHAYFPRSDSSQYGGHKNVIVPADDIKGAMDNFLTAYPQAKIQSIQHIGEFFSPDAA